MAMKGWRPVLRPTKVIAKSRSSPGGRRLPGRFSNRYLWITPVPSGDVCQGRVRFGLATSSVEIVRDGLIEAVEISPARSTNSN
jgi:hypothetical protein